MVITNVEDEDSVADAVEVGTVEVELRAALRIVQLYSATTVDNMGTMLDSVLSPQEYLEAVALVKV